MTQMMIMTGGKKDVYNAEGSTPACNNPPRWGQVSQDQPGILIPGDGPDMKMCIMMRVWPRECSQDNVSCRSH